MGSRPSVSRLATGRVNKGSSSRASVRTPFSEKTSPDLGRTSVICGCAGVLSTREAGRSQKLRDFFSNSFCQCMDMRRQKTKNEPVQPSITAPALTPRRSRRARRPRRRRGTVELKQGPSLTDSLHNQWERNVTRGRSRETEVDESVSARGVWAHFASAGSLGFGPFQLPDERTAAHVTRAGRRVKGERHERSSRTLRASSAK